MYIDSNIFIFSAVNTDQLGDNCRQILWLIDNGKVSGVSSYLVIDEVLWILQKKIGRDDAVKTGRMIISLPIKWIEVSTAVTLKAIDIFESEGLDPRDSFHVSTMKVQGITTMVSEDDDFDDVNGIERIDAAECIQRFG